MIECLFINNYRNDSTESGSNDPFNVDLRLDLHTSSSSSRHSLPNAGGGGSGSVGGGSSGGAPSGAGSSGGGTGGVGAGSIGTGSIGAGSIGAGSIGAGSIGAGSIGAGSIGAGSIGAGSIGTSGVGASGAGTGTVGTGAVGTGAVGTGAVGTGAVGTGAVGTGAVGTGIVGTGAGGGGASLSPVSSYSNASTAVLHTSASHNALSSIQGSTLNSPISSCSNSSTTHLAVPSGCGGSSGSSPQPASFIAPQTPPTGRRQTSWDLLDQNAIAIAKQQRHPLNPPQQQQDSCVGSSGAGGIGGAKALFKTQRSFSVPTTRDQRSLERNSGGLKSGEQRSQSPTPPSSTSQRECNSARASVSGSFPQILPI